MNDSLLHVGILKGLQILVVDNDIDSGVLYSIFLQHFGANVIISSSINEALEVLIGFIPNIIICEIRFFGENVYQLFKRLIAIESDHKNRIPVIVTSTSTIGITSELPEIEIERYLLKPVNLDQLILMITNLLLTGKKTSSDDQLKYQCSSLIEVKDDFIINTWGKFTVDQELEVRNQETSYIHNFA